MHRHSYRTRKLSRERAQRRALLKSLATALILYEEITTTRPKAKELVPFIEKLITKAKAATPHTRRQVAGVITDPVAYQKLYEDIIPRLQTRHSGHVSRRHAGFRQGDFAEQATVSFIFDPTTPARSNQNATTSSKSSAKQPTQTKSGASKAKPQARPSKQAAAKGK